MTVRKQILFVCSSALHVQLFASVIRLLLESNDLVPVIVSLDKFYSGIHGNVASRAKQLNLKVLIKEVDFSRGKGRNPLIQVLGSICSVHAYGTLVCRELFGQNHSSLVIFGNDTGHAERAVLRMARRLGLSTLLVQDGFLFDQFPNSGFCGWLRLVTTQLWLACGGDHLGAVPYGMGGCDYITAHGEVWAEMFRNRRRMQTKKISVIGHPTLELTSPIDIGNSEGRDVVFFCTNYLSGHKDQEAHRNQISEILILRKLMTEKFGVDSVLRVNIHPADSKADYTDILIMGIELNKDADLPSLIGSSWICVTNISSVSLECLSYGRVCLMSGVSLQKGPYRQLFSSLPGTKFKVWDEFLTYIEELNTSCGYARILQMQKDILHPYMDIHPSKPGAVRLASLIAELACVAQ